MTEPVPVSPWDVLRTATQARIGLGRSGDALPTRQVLELLAAHAAARDAVHEPLHVAALAEAVAAIGIGDPLLVTSRAATRSEYLRRPDLGRQPADVSGLSGSAAQVGIVLADGLSPRALREHGPGLLAAIVAELRSTYSIAVPVIATQARVALADHVAAAMGVETLVVLIGERPGLSAADSLGVYLTHQPRPGRADSDRNCISNIRPPDGLGYEAAARIVAGLVRGARTLGVSGVRLKDTSRGAALTSADPEVIGGG